MVVQDEAGGVWNGVRRGVGGTGSAPRVGLVVPLFPLFCCPFCAEESTGSIYARVSWCLYFCSATRVCNNSTSFGARMSLLAGVGHQLHAPILMRYPSISTWMIRWSMARTRA